MKLLEKILLIQTLMFGLYSCGSTSDDYRELSGGYFYRGEGGEKEQIISHSPNRKEIYGKIISYDYNSDFIIALQEPNYEDYKDMIGFNLQDDLKKYPVNSVEERMQSEKRADSILRNNEYYKKIFASKINYWIISHTMDSVIGPLNKEEFLQKKKELNVPSNLEIK